MNPAQVETVKNLFLYILIGLWLLACLGLLLAASKG